MSIYLAGGVSNVDAEVDSNRNQVVVGGLPAVGAAGGYYTVTGWTVAVIAAALAADTFLMGMQLVSTSSRKAYVERMRVTLAPATVGASAGVAGTLGLRRWTSTPPTSGTSRTPNQQNAAVGTVSDMTVVRDNNAALTGGSQVWGNIVASSLVPVFTTGTGFEWIYEPMYPTVLAPGDGLALRTLFAMAATQTWMYSYTFHWYEK